MTRFRPDLPVAYGAAGQPRSIRMGPRSFVLVVEFLAFGL